MSNIPQYQPLKGIAIIGFTKEQVRTYNVRLFEGTEFEIVDKFHPDMHSIEEGQIFYTSRSQEELKPGDNVLVDYAVFTAGRHKDINSSESRLIYRDDEWYLYWCYDDQHAVNSSEIYATIDDEGKVKAFGDCIIIYPQKEHEVMIEIMSSVADFHQWPGTMLALVKSSASVDIPDSAIIICEIGYSPTLIFRGIEMQYINFPYVLGLLNPQMPFKVQLL